MASTVELTAMGFVVEDDFGPEGRRPVYGGSAEAMGPIVFAARFRADEYARLRNVHAAHFAEQGYGGNEWELREACKQYARNHGRIFTRHELLPVSEDATSTR